MKKNYLAPNVLIVKVSTQCILEGSPVNTTGLGGFGGFGGVDANGSKDPSSRSTNSLWDDDEDF